MRALLIVDMQNDFMPGGELPTPEGDAIIPLINQLMDAFPLVVASKDWHPPNHASFMGSGGQWPAHCVQGTGGAEFAEGLEAKQIDAVFHKGTDALTDSYSAFFDGGKKRETGLADYLRQKGVDALTIVGVATDYCVLHSALDARSRGFDVTVITDGVKAICLKEGDDERALEEMRGKGIHLKSAQEALA